MRLLITFFFLLVLVTKVYSQNSIYLEEKDTLFIVYPSEYVVREYSKIKSDTNRSNTGINSIYFLLDSTLVTKRNKFYRSREEAYKKGGGAIGASSTCDWCFGLYFVHKTNAHNTNGHKQDSLHFQKDLQYKMFKKNFLENEPVSLKDSLEFDRGIYLFVNYRYNPPTSNLLLTKRALEEKNVFYFDGSTEKYNELLELVKEPHHLFMLEKKWTKQELDSNFTKTEYYIFNEVMYRHRTRSAYPELTRDN